MSRKALNICGVDILLRPLPLPLQHGERLVAVAYPQSLIQLPEVKLPEGVEALVRQLLHQLSEEGVPIALGGHTQPPAADLPLIAESAQVGGGAPQLPTLQLSRDHPDQLLFGPLFTPEESVRRLI